VNIYRQTIALFGIALPTVAAAALVGAGFMAKSEMEASFEKKQSKFKASNLNRIASLEIETQVVRQRKDIERWNAQLAQETASAVTTNLREICERLSSKEIQQTAFERPNVSGGFGSISAQNSSLIRIAFRGTYRTMQRAFLELETRMPQLQLQEIRIDPSSTQSSLLNFQVTYTSWES
jgi:hypothetical protein